MENEAVIYINARFLMQPITGVQRFAIEVCRELKRQGVKIQLLSPANVLHTDIAKELGNKKIGGEQQGHYWEQFILTAFLKRLENPVLLNLCNTGPLFYPASVVTIHDLAFLKHPKWFAFTFRKLYRFLVPQIAKNAAVVFTVSEFVKKEIILKLKVAQERVHVAYNGLSSTFYEPSSKKMDSDRPYFLTFGGQNTRKNVKGVIGAMQLLEDQEYDLRIVGRAEENFMPNETNYDAYDFQIIQHNDVDDQELKRLYAGAEALIYPSLYEGFGLPPLEALNSSCPIIISNIEVFRELYSGFATFVDPTNVQSIKEGILKVVQGNNEVISAESLNALNARFSYVETAKIMAQVIGDLNEGMHGTE